MTIQITQPEIEALIQQRLTSGAFKDAQDVILQALRSSEPETQPVRGPADAGRRISRMHKESKSPGESLPVPIALVERRLTRLTELLPHNWQPATSPAEG